MNDPKLNVMFEVAILMYDGFLSSSVVFVYYWLCFNNLFCLKSRAPAGNQSHLIYIGI